jgi:hypothetical protein
MVSFRVNDEEYDRFRTLSVSLGLSNVSELVRAAVNQLSSKATFIPRSHKTDLAKRVAHIECRLAKLDAALAEIGASQVATPFKRTDPSQMKIAETLPE